VAIPACRGAIEAKEYAAIHQSVTLPRTPGTPTWRSADDPRGGLKAARHRLTIRWRARGARGVTLTGAIQYRCQTLAAGITAGSYSQEVCEVDAGVKELNFDRISAEAAADPSPARLTGPTAMARLAAATPPLGDEQVEEV
jgi:hypothetical protein